jgi:hypothetical protein
MVTTRKITRLEAIKDQLNTACKAYFLWDDLVSALILAGAAERVMSDIQSQDGIFGVDAYSIRSIINLYIKPEHQKETAKLYRADYDFFRHADVKTQQDYELKHEVVDFYLFVALLGFEHLQQKKTQAMRAYLLWFSSRNPNLLKTDTGKFTHVAKELGNISKDMSKQDYYELFCSVDSRP